MTEPAHYKVKLRLPGDKRPSALAQGWLDHVTGRLLQEMREHPISIITGCGGYVVSGDPDGGELILTPFDEREV